MVIWLTPSPSTDHVVCGCPLVKNKSPFQASERQLNPIRKESTPVELLMESIRNSNARASLRKTGGPRKRSQGNSILINTLCKK